MTAERSRTALGRRRYLQGVAGVAAGTAALGDRGRDGVAAAAEFPQADADGSTIGGGDADGDTVTESEATAVVSSQGGLLDALDAAGSGDVVFVDGGATVDMTGVSDVTI